MAPRKRTRPTLQELLAEREARISWERLEACDLEEWLQLSDRQQQEAMQRAYETELNR